MSLEKASDRGVFHKGRRTAYSRFFLVCKKLTLLFATFNSVSQKSLGAPNNCAWLDHQSHPVQFTLNQVKLMASNAGDFPPYFQQKQNFSK